MYILGTPDGVARPNGFLQGPKGQIPITSFDATFSVGSIPTARIGVIPEFLDQISEEQGDQLFTVRVRDGDKGKYYTLFKGYMSGDCGRRNEREFSSGINLIHPARDLDQMRLSAPSLHPDSADDWSYQRQNANNAAGGGAIGLSDVFFSESKPLPLPKQIIDGVLKFLSHTSLSVARGAYGFKSESYEPAQKLLKGITCLNGKIRPEIGSVLGQNNNLSSINAMLRQMVTNSFSARRSLWDMMSAICSEFGLTLICDNAGHVFITVDSANFTPPKENVLDGDYICSYDYESRFRRQFKEVMVISNFATCLDIAGTTSFTSGTIAVWPPIDKRKPNETGATLSLQMPSWLTPISYQISPDALRQEPPSPSDPEKKPAPPTSESQRIEIAKVQQAYAHMLYDLERDKLRTFSVAGPLAPTVVPGTNAYVSPYSAVHAKGLKGGGELKNNSVTYSAYCYSVSHHVDCQARASTMSTVFQFRNFSRVEEGLNIDEHPIFSDVKPFAWQN